MVDDGYVAWYQAKLWQLLPAIYRAMDDPDSTGVPGPLQELVNRIGAQTAVVRRGIDRVWDNQSIETCDDWVIPYIGDLLGTRLVSCLDAQRQRVDVANTIYYRRRSGTLGLLEQLVHDIARRDARAVEFFRRLGRTRHQFDPPIGNVFDALADTPAWTANTTFSPGQVVINGANAYQCTAGGVSAASGTGPAGTGTAITDGAVTWAYYDPASSLVPAVIEGLAGATSHTPAGGFADLRNRYGAASAGTAFDEFAYTADLRRGGQSQGWQNISHLGVFIWWLQTFPITGARAVSNGQAAPCFTFDPTGRQLRLFAPGARNAASFGDAWVSPDEWTLPVPVRGELWGRFPDQLYPVAFQVGYGGAVIDWQTRDQVQIDPERGQFSFPGGPQLPDVVTGYHFGFMSTIGAGGFDAALLEDLVTPAATTTVTDNTTLAAALGGVGAGETVVFGNSLTYAGPATTLTLPAQATLALQAGSGTRPVIRWAGIRPNTWTIAGTGSTLVLQGIWLQGADIVLTGSFAAVTLRLATLDPGSDGGPGVLVADAIDGTPLAPVHLWVEAKIGTITLERCITGPIRTRSGGTIEHIIASDSIIQAIPTTAAADLALQTEAGDVALARCTVLGPAAVHRLSASESILDDIAVAEDTQHGCVRFSAYATGSALHAPFQSVAVPPVGPVFVSRRFGEPSYARLLRHADAAIIAPATGDTILGGAENGAEMGAFSGEQVTLIKRGLAIKFEEYAPLGVYPVWIDAD